MIQALSKQMLYTFQAISSTFMQYTYSFYGSARQGDIKLVHRRSSRLNYQILRHRDIFSYYVHQMIIQMTIVE